MQSNAKALICALITLIAAAAGHAGVPGLISYQGQLNDDAGVPVNSTVSFVFSIYDVAEGGTALWTESQMIPVSNGVFNVQLGASQTIPSVLFNKNALYLGIKVGADAEMTPRQMLTSSAYSFRAEMSVPIGAILPWHKSMAGTPALPEGWVECNGQVLSDADSPYDGETIPNLNGSNLFLRGETSSGTNAPTHTHTFSTGTQIVTMGNRLAYDTGQDGNHHHTGTTSSGGTAFGVVFIMRIR